MNKYEQLDELIARCALKDQQAFRTIYDLTAPLLHSVVYPILRNKDMCYDVLQEAYLQIWKNSSQFSQNKGAALSWITSIARYRAYDRLEKEKHCVPLTPEFADSLINDEVAPHVKALWDEEQRAFQDCLLQLETKSRQIIQLAYLQGYSREMLANLYQTKINTMKSWLSRGVALLTQCIQSKRLER